MDVISLMAYCSIVSAESTANSSAGLISGEPSAILAKVWPASSRCIRSSAFNLWTIKLVVYIASDMYFGGEALFPSILCTIN